MVSSEQIYHYKRYVFDISPVPEIFKAADAFYILGILYSNKRDVREYDLAFYRLIRACRICVSRGKKTIEDIIIEIGYVPNVEEGFIKQIAEVAIPYYEFLLNNNLKFTYRREIDSKVVASYYAGRSLLDREIDPNEIKLGLYRKYTKARKIAISILSRLI